MLLQNWICDPTMQNNAKNARDVQHQHKKRKKKSVVVFVPFFFCRSPNGDIFMEFLAFDEELNEVAQGLDDTIAHLLPPSPKSSSATMGPCKAPYHT